MNGITLVFAATCLNSSLDVASPGKDTVMGCDDFPRLLMVSFKGRADAGTGGIMQLSGVDG